MVMTDPIADMLTRIRNASMVYHDSVDVPASNLKKEVARILKDEGFIRDYRIIDDGKQGTVRLYLKYGANRERVISGLKRISKPGRRVYARRDQIPRRVGRSRGRRAVHIQRRDERQRGTQARCGRRSRLLRLVAARGR